MTTFENKINVLHVHTKFNPGGIEKWLIALLQHTNARRFVLHFLVEQDVGNHFYGTLLDFGAKLVFCESPKKPLAFSTALSTALVRNGPYQIIHSHDYTFSGLVLALAALKGVPVRIAHSHNDLRSTIKSSNIKRRLYATAMRTLIHRCATGGIAVSSGAAFALFGKKWQQDFRWICLPCGIDFSKFDISKQSADEGIRFNRNNRPIIGHVGRFVEQKNHNFVVQVFYHFSLIYPNARLLLVGDGPLLPFVRDLVARLGIADKVMFAGIRNDVPALLRDVIDVFLFPSLHEGIGLVAVEAQAVGVPVVASTNVPPEAKLYEGGINFLSLTDPIAQWVKRIEDATHKPTQSIQEALARAQKTVFSIDNNVAQVQDFYERQLKIRNVVCG